MADENNVIKTTVELETSKAEKNISNLGDSANDSLRSIEKGAIKAGSGFNKLDEATGGTIAKFKALAKTPLVVIIGALVAAFSAMKTAVSRSGKASETFGKIAAKLSSIMNGALAVIEPLVEFIGEKLLGALNSPLDSLKELGNLIKENLINRVKSFLILGEAFTLLLKGEFSAAAKKGGEAIVQLATGVENLTGKVTEFAEVAEKKYDEAAKASLNLANSEKVLERNRIALEKQQLRSLTLAEKERQIRDDVTKTTEERIAANDRLGKILDKQSKAELALAQQNLNIARSQKAATGDTIENIAAVGDAEIKLLEIRERIIGQRSEQLVNEQSLSQELKLSELDNQNKIDQAKVDLLKSRGLETLELEKEILEKKRLQELENETLTQLGKDEINAKFKLQREELQIAADEKKLEEDNLKKETLLEIEALEIERLKEKDAATLEREIAFLEAKRVQDVSQAKLTAEQIILINKKAEDAKNKVRQDEKKASADKEKAILDNAINAAGEAFGIKQELAVAEMIMKAPAAISGIFKEGAQLPFPLNVAHITTGLATTLPPIVKGLADIKNTRFSKKKSGGGAGGGTISVPSVPSASSTPSSSASSSTPTELISSLGSNGASNIGIDPNLGSSASRDASSNVVGSRSSNIVFSEARYNDFQNQVQFKENKTTL